MSNPSSYDLLVKVDEKLDRIEDKLGKRFDGLEVRVNNLESFKDTWQGRIAIISVLIGTFMSLIVSLIVNKTKELLGIKI